MIALGILLGIIGLAVIAQLIELRFFRLTTYEITSPKVTNGFRVAIIADLHGFSYGKGNERLLSRIREVKPDLILIAGDLIVRKKTAGYQNMAAFAAELPKIAPSYFSFGNHESRAELQFPEFVSFVEALQKSGIVFLRNECRKVTVNADSLTLYGLEIPISYYEKRKEQTLPEGFLTGTFGSCDQKTYSILLAHNPAYGDAYFRWGADLTVSGHTHGGLVRIPGGRSIISPELTFFPKYDGGHYTQDRKHLVVSKGLGTHTFHIRIFDRAELVLIDVKSPS